MEEKNAFFAFAKDAVLKQSEVLKNDARAQILAGSFLSTTNQLDEALANLEHARELIPNKQQVYFEIGSVYLSKNEPLNAFNEFKKALDLAPDYKEAKSVYLVGAIYANNKVAENEMLVQIPEEELVFDDRVLAAYYNVGRIDVVKILLNERIKLDPVNKATYEEYLKSIAN